MQVEFSGIKLSEKEERIVSALVAGYGRKEHTQIFHIRNVEKQVSHTMEKRA